ncbi:acyltransferase domain-containing protein [Streptomyces sp. AV19]|uniref:type I polyketide synthase n=1 Tax=Streptomyces sp. AV19 TaxID=2793068 RepID=UPI0018FE76D0|nr:type I polyketide synthase [Streptomyces sp. AV19]MBH1934819.1 acyltransferase domain-containing protein [Streptomyces sp. AV19]MDG4530576.1 acyltransferase domain-containing protein [Streptomyces sp. AV19]
MTPEERAEYEDHVAVIGMAGRFPGAPDVERFWENLLQARETVSVLDDRRDPARPEFTPAYGVLDGAGDFDAGFFGLSPNDALITDPQQRLLLECAHEALERAGHGAEDRPVTGVFVGASANGYAEAVRARLDRLPFLDEWQLRQANATDFLATRIAYHLDLTGPALAVQTACSTSLVAVHVAVQALLNGECDMALAGGASVLPHLPRPRYTPGGIVSPDGHCRTFDADSAGTVGASAVGLVVLRPLIEALEDGDHVHAVIRGSAVNNDGRHKAGFTAPGVAGQAEVVRAAHLAAGVDAGDVGYVEAHGTATALGDPIEVTALTRAFRESTDRRGHCRIGSVKTNVGHADAAAGVVGLIKTVLSVEHGVLPASLHFRRPNPAIDFASSPFEVNAATRPWESAGPRIAGVNALGVGGTNAHVVVAEPPARPASPPGRRHQLVVVSGRTATAADEAARRLAGHLRSRPGTHLADAAWTLQTGRTHHPHRRFVVARDAGGAAAALPAVTGGGAASGAEPVFLFAGQGGQHLGMASELYADEPEFRRHLDEAAEWAAGPLGLDLRETLFPADEGGRPAAAARLATIALSQPAVFAVQYATARLLESWGIRPAAVTGHSLGAYAAACVAGVFAPRDAMRLVVERGRLLGTVPAGAMAAVKLPEDRLAPQLPPELSVGAVNGPGQCTVTGPAKSVARFAEELVGRGVEARLLRIDTAGHSPLVEPISGRFAEFVGSLERGLPVLPVLSDTTGQWADPEEVRSVAYWTRHLREPVRFGEALTTLFGSPVQALVDIGPGRTLSTLARQHPGYEPKQAVVHLTPHPAEDASQAATLLSGVGELWARGAELDFAALHGGEERRRVVLPSYPFERRTYLVPPLEPTAATAAVADGGTPDSWIGPTAGTTAGTPTTAEPGDAAEAVTPVLAAVLTAFGQALGIPGIEPDDSLFDLGGDSLTAVKLASWAAEEFAAPVTAADVLRGQDARTLATLLEERGAGARSAA